MIAPQSSLSLMELLRSHLKLGVSLLIGSAVLACTAQLIVAALQLTHGVKAIPSPAHDGRPAAIVLIGGGVAGSAYSDESADR